MQGGKCIAESFHNIVDLNQQSVLSSSNVNHSTAWWGNLQDDHRYQPKQSGVISESGSNHGENHVTKRLLNLPGPRNTESQGAYMRSSEDHLHSTSSNSYKNGRETRARTNDLSLNNHGASSSTSNFLINGGDKSGSSLGKRKDPDGGHAIPYASSHLQDVSDFVQHTVPASSNASGSITTAPPPMEPEQLNLTIGIEKREVYSEASSAQVYAGRSSSSPLAPDNIMQHTGPTSKDALASITAAASPMEWSFTSQPEQLNLRIGIEERETYSEFFPPPNITDIAENDAENIGERLNVGQQEPNLFLFPFTDTALRPAGSSSMTRSSRSFQFTDASLTINSSTPPIESHEIRGPENSGSMLPSHWSGSLDPHTGRRLKSLRFSGGSSTAIPDAQNSRISLRNHSDFSASDTTTVGRRSQQDSSALNFASVNTLPFESLLPSSRSGSDLIMQNLPTGWAPPQNWTGPNQQGVTQYSPQLPLQPPLRNYRSQRGHFPVIPPTLSSLNEGAIPSFSSQGRQNQSLRSALLIGEHNDPISHQNGLAVDIEARQRLVRQVRNTMQRGVNRRAQNVTIGVTELHDRHREMRLDIDNMSYEELLALGERIGNVSTGVSDEVIMRSMKQRKHLPMSSTSNSEPCCICQDEFIAGDDIGATVCGHEFHFKCIKQWLSLKNLCPICKKKAIDS